MRDKIHIILVYIPIHKTFPLIQSETKEEKKCIDVMAECMLAIPLESKNRYGITYDMPVGIELKMGKNWLDLEEVLTV